MTKMKMLSKVN